MTTIFNGFLPSRKNDQFAQDRILNTRWGDAGISSPIHGGWNANSQSATQSQSSPELDRDLPPTPPQIYNEQDIIRIIHDDEDEHDSEDDTVEINRDSVTITIPLPWKRKKSTSSHSRKGSSNNAVLNHRFSQSNPSDLMPASLATAEAAAVPLPQSRISSPISRSNGAHPVLSFRTRLASPTLGDILSPVAEGFAKNGPSSRTAHVVSSLQYAEPVAIERPSSASSVRFNAARRHSLTNYNSADGIGASTMSSQGQSHDQHQAFQILSSQGLDSTAHMRAFSRGPRPASRGPTPTSFEPASRRALSTEPVNRRVSTPPATEPTFAGVLDSAPVRRRAPSAEPMRRRAPSTEPTRRRAPSADMYSRRAPSVDAYNRRAPSTDNHSQRAPSTGPRVNVQAEPRDTRGRSKDRFENTKSSIRFHSETACRPRRRSDSCSSNDGSIDSEPEESSSCPSEIGKSTTRGHKDFRTTRRPRRRRSIASPISSPTSASFSTSKSTTTPPPSAATKVPTYDSIAARAGLVRPTAPLIPSRNPPHYPANSRTRGLYAEMHDDFRLLARDVHLDTSPTSIPHSNPQASNATIPITTTIQSLTNTTLQRGTSHADFTTSPSFHSTGIAAAIALRATEAERPGYSSDGSLPTTHPPQLYPHTFGHPADHQSNGKALLAALARDRKDQLRREERERAREKVARKLERRRDELLALHALSDSESVVSGAGNISGSEKTRRVYGGSATGECESDTTMASGYSRTNSGGGGFGGRKIMVPNAEEIWG